MDFFFVLHFYVFVLQCFLLLFAAWERGGIWPKDAVGLFVVVVVRYRIHCLVGQCRKQDAGLDGPLTCSSWALLVCQSSLVQTLLM